MSDELGEGVCYKTQWGVIMKGQLLIVVSNRVSVQLKTQTQTNNKGALMADTW